MKKHLYMAIGASALLFGACSEDKEPASDQDTTARVVVTVDSPESLTRSDGTSATTLQYALYDIIGGEFVLVGEVNTIDDASYPYEIPSFDVVTGHTYGLLFWATAFQATSEDNPYSVDWKNGEMTVIYENAKANSVDLDAFYAYETFTVEGDLNLSITMERPFAMINIGTSQAPAEGAESSITVTNVPSSLNLITGEVSEFTDGASFGYAAVPSGMQYPIEGYKYLAFAYVLAPSTPGAASTVTYEYKVGDGVAVTNSVENITLQANYKVNIYGDLP